MNRSHYDPPKAPVTDPVSSGAKLRWKWLLVPLGHTAFTFLWLLGRWWWVQPAESGSLNFSIDARALRWIAREAFYQGGVVLVVTCLSLAILPRIHLRHAVYFSLASVFGSCAVELAATYVHRPITTNGEQLMSIVFAYALVLLIGAAFIRRSDINVG